MNPKNGLRIGVSQPCSENWEAMLQKGDGKFCSNCQKTVIDFSCLTDRELYNYFSKTSYIPCGRFHNTQLNKILAAPDNKKKGWNKFYKAAATVIALLSLKYTGATARWRTNDTIITAHFDKSKINVLADKIIITGIVKDENGNPLANAEIKFGETLVTKSDIYGNFEFEVKNDKGIKPSLLLVSYPGLVSAVRNYHPVMLSTNYTINLTKYGDPGSYFTMGIPILFNVESMPPVSINFNRADTALSPNAKILLSELATWLRNHPEAGINITTLVKNNSNRNTGKQFQTFVIKYLSDQEGISEERMKTDLEVIPAIDKNTLEISGFRRY